MPHNTQAWYRQWFNSPLYYQLYQHRNEAEAQAFVEAIAAHLQIPPGAELLDIACGKGRHSRILHNLGYKVTGIDLAGEAIAYAKQFEDENLRFYEHDMRLPFFINYFDAAFNFFTSFGYFKTQREHDNALRSISQSLKPHGKLVIDYLNVHYAEDHLVGTEEKQIEENTFSITRWHNEDHFFKQIQLKNAGPDQHHHLYTERVAKFSLGDFTEMLAYQGMQIKEVFGDYQLGPYHLRQSPRLIMIAEKRRQGKG